MLSRSKIEFGLDLTSSITLAREFRPPPFRDEVTLPISMAGGMTEDGMDPVWLNDWRGGMRSAEKWKVALFMSLNDQRGPVVHEAHVHEAHGFSLSMLKNTRVITA